MVSFAVKGSNYAYIDHGAQFWYALMQLAILLRIRRTAWEQRTVQQRKEPLGSYC